MRTPLGRMECWSIGVLDVNYFLKDEHPTSNVQRSTFNKKIIQHWMLSVECSKFFSSVKPSLPTLHHSIKILSSQIRNPHSAIRNRKCVDSVFCFFSFQNPQSKIQNRIIRIQKFFHGSITPILHYSNTPWFCFSSILSHIPII